MRRLTPCHWAGRVSRTASQFQPFQPVPASTSQQHSVSGVETMSSTQSWARTPAAPPLRVRDQAREAAALIAFSAATASCLALALLVLAHLGRQG